MWSRLPPPGGPDEWVRTQSSEIGIVRVLLPEFWTFHLARRQNEYCDIFIPQDRINTWWTLRLCSNQIGNPLKSFRLYKYQLQTWSSPLSPSSPSSPSSPRVWLPAVRVIMVLYHFRNNADNMHFQVVGPMYVHVNLWPWNTWTQLLFLSYAQALAMWVQDNFLSAAIILTRFSGPAGSTCCGPIVNGVGKWVNLAGKLHHTVKLMYANAKLCPHNPWYLPSSN